MCRAVCLALLLPAAASPNAGFDPCSLLTPEEVGAAIAAPSVVRLQLDEKRCQFSQPDKYNILIVEAAPHGAGTYFAGTSLAFRLMGTTASPGPAVGDASFFWILDIMFTARRGDAYVTIDMRGTEGDKRAIGPALAARVLQRME